MSSNDRFRCACVGVVAAALLWVFCSTRIFGLASIFGVGYASGRLAAGVWKKFESEGFCDAGGFWDGPFCWEAGGEPVSRWDVHPESMCVLISLGLTALPHIGQSTMLQR